MIAGQTEPHDIGVTMETIADMSLVSHTFEDMRLKPDLLSGILEYGIHTPSNLQRNTLLNLLRGLDMEIQAKSGSDATTALIVTLLHRIDTTVKNTQAILVVSTRELALALEVIVRHLGAHLNVEYHAYIGALRHPGTEVNTINESHLIVSTPGRLLNAFNTGVISASNVKMMFLDELDELLARGFKEHIGFISQLLPGCTQVVSTSSTQPEDMVTFALKLMHNPVHYRLPGSSRITLEGYRQFCIVTEKEERKLDTLYDLYETIDVTQAIVFCNTRQKVEWLTEQLKERGFSVSAIHTDQEASEREQLLKDYRSGITRVLVATELPARGPNISPFMVLVHYDPPKVCEDYVCRLGGGERLRRNNTTILLVTGEDFSMLREIEQFYTTEIIEMTS